MILSAPWFSMMRLYCSGVMSSQTEAVSIITGVPTKYRSASSQ